MRQRQRFRAATAVTLTAVALAPPTATIAPPLPSQQPGPPGAQVLQPKNGYVFVETKSGLTRCQLSSDDVSCESDFQNAPVVDGEHGSAVAASSRIDVA